MAVLNVQEVQVGVSEFPISQWNMVTDNTASEVQQTGFLNSSFKLGNSYKDGDFANVNTTDSGTLYFQISVNNGNYSLILPYDAAIPIPNNDMMANISGGSSVPVGVSATEYLDSAFTNVQGSILYRNASGWTTLAPSVDGYILKTNGAGADIAWEAGTASIDVSNNEMVANISGSTGPVTGVTASDYLDSAFSNVQGTILYRNASGWTTLPPSVSGYFLQTNGAAANISWSPAFTPSAISNNQLMANTSGSSAIPVGTNLSAYFDSAIGSTENTSIVRNATSWVETNRFPSSLIPIDNVSLTVETDRPFLDYNLAPTGLFPLQMIAFDEYVVIINNLANTVETFRVSPSNVVTSVDVIATGGNPQALINFVISGTTYLAVTNAADDTFSLYSFDFVTETFSQVGSPISTIAISPRGIAFNLIAGTPCLTLSGYIANVIQLFTWNGTTFISASSGVSTGSAPGSLASLDFSGSSYTAAVNTTGASASVYKYVGSDWVLQQTVTTDSTPLSLILFEFESVMYLAVANSIGDSIQTWKFNGTTFVANGDTSSAGLPVSIVQWEQDGVCYLSVVGTLTSSLRTYIYDTIGATLAQDGLETPTRGATPADLIAYKLQNADGSYTQYISVTNSLSNNMTTFYYAEGLISIAPIPTNMIMSNINTVDDVPVGNTVSDILDATVSDVQGSLLTRTATEWTAVPPGPSGEFLQSQGAGANLTWASGGGLTSIANNQLLANISGATAIPVGVSATSYFDSAFGSTVNTTVVRTPSGWIDVESIPASLVPIDTDSLATTGTDLFYSFGVTTTGNSPTQLVVFGNLVSVINSVSQTVTTYSVVSPSTITLLSTVGTGTTPTALAYCPILTSEYLVVTNSGDDTFQLYTWNTGSQSWIVTGIAQFTFVSQPAGVIYCNLNNTTPAIIIVGGPASNQVQLFLWNGSIFTPTGAAVSTGGSTPGQASSYTFGSVSYIAVVNTASSNISIFTYNGTALVMSQLVSCNANPVASTFFESDGDLYLTAACNSAGTIDVFKLSGSTFTSVSSLGSIPSPTSIAYFYENGQNYISIVSSALNAILTYIYSTNAQAFYWGSNVSTAGTGPADMAPFTITNPDTSVTQLMAISNTTSNNLSVLYFQDDLITLAPIPNSTLLANTSGAASTPVATTTSGLLDATVTNTRGAILYRGASGWTYLPPSVSGYFLQTQGGFADPVWADSLVPVLDGYVLANIAGSTASPRGYALSDIIDTVFGSTVGAILVRGASAWTILPAGAANTYLKSAGAGVVPSWSAGTNPIVTALVSVTDGVTLYTITVTGVTTSSRVVASINQQSGSIYLTQVLTGTDSIRFYFSGSTSGVTLSYMLEI